MRVHVECVSYVNRQCRIYTDVDWGRRSEGGLWGRIWDDDDGGGGRCGDRAFNVIARIMWRTRGGYVIARLAGCGTAGAQVCQSIHPCSCSSWPAAAAAAACCFRLPSGACRSDWTTSRWMDGDGCGSWLQRVDCLSVYTRPTDSVSGQRCLRVSPMSPLAATDRPPPTRCGLVVVESTHRLTDWRGFCSRLAGRRPPTITRDLFDYPLPWDPEQVDSFVRTP